MCLCGHRQLWRPQMGGTKWNKGGTSEGTYGPVGWEFVFLRKFTSVGQKFPKWPHRIWNTMFKNVGPKLVVFFKSGPNHEKMWALCSTIITWPRKITKSVPALKSNHRPNFTKMALLGTMCSISHPKPSRSWLKLCTLSPYWIWRWCSRWELSHLYGSQTTGGLKPL